MPADGVIRPTVPALRPLCGSPSLTEPRALASAQAEGVRGVRRMVQSGGPVRTGRSSPTNS